MEKKIDEKMVIIPMEEYETMKKQSDGYSEIRDELKKDAEERGYYIENRIVWTSSSEFADSWNGFTYAGPMLKVVGTKDEAVEKLGKEIERMSEVMEKLNKELNKKRDAIQEIRRTRRGEKLLEKIGYKED